MTAGSRLVPLLLAVAGGVGVAVIAFPLVGRLGTDPVTSTVEHGASSTLSEGEVPVGRSPDVPDLPFADNPDPTKCGIPVAWRGQDSRAWLTGVWEGELVQPDVLLYDGHLRLGIKGSAPHGAEVEIVLYQSNPVVDYYMVEVVGADRVRGWVPAPFLSMDRVSA